MAFGKTRLGGLVVVFLAAALLAVPAWAQDKVIIGGMTTSGGAYAAVGEDSVRGYQAAIEEVGGKVLGKPVELMVIDDQNQPGVAARKVREAVESKGVRYFAGAISSGVGLAIGQVANETKSIYFTSVGADEVTGTQCNRYTFRWSVPTYGAAQQTIAPLIKKFPEAKRWYTITPDYVFGHSLLNNAKEIFKQAGVEHVGNDMHPIGHTEFSSFLTKAMGAKADVVVFFNFGKDTINALKQANNFGVTKKAKILVAWSAGVRDLVEIGPEFAEGVFFGCQFWHTTDAPLTKALSQTWLKKHKSQPTYTEASPYIMAKLLLAGMEKAKSTDPTAVVKALEGMKYDGLTGEEFIQPFDHQVNKNYYLLQAKAKADIKDPFDLATIISFGKSFKTEAQSDCKMK